MRYLSSLLAVCALALITPISASGDYTQAFSSAIRAMDRSQWAEAVSALNEAIRDQPVAGGYVIIYGTRREQYLPYFLLGKAHMQLGNCEAALTAFRKEEGQGVIQSDASKFRELKQLKSKCPERENPPPPPPSLAQFGNEPASARPAQTQSATPEPEPAPVKRTEPTREELPDAKPPADTRASQAAEKPDRAEVDRLIEARVAKGELESRLQQARSLLRERSSWNVDTALVAEGITLADLVRRGEAALQGDNQSIITRISRDILSSKARIDSLVRLGETPSPDLVAILAAYTNGDYARVINLADRFQSTRTRSRAQATLFRAAALYGTHMRTGEAQTEDLADAREALAELRKLDPGLAPSKTVFPPALIALYDQAR